MAVDDVGHAVEINDRISLVSRGGSFLDSPAATRSAYRGFDRPSVHDPSVGLRPARTWP
jgi:formylglycine-generating enzyme required for sulfatase activity